MTTRPRRTPWQRWLQALEKLGAARDPTAICRLLVQEAAALSGADGAVVAVWEPSGELALWHAAGVGEALAPAVLGAFRPRQGAGPSGRRVRVLRSAAAGARRRSRLALLMASHGLGSVALVPLASAGDPVGMLALLHRRPTPYGRWRRQALGGLARQAALSLEAARLQGMYDRLQAAYRQLEAFHHIGAELASSLDVGRVLEAVARYAAELTGSDAGGVFEYDAAEGILRVSAGYRASRAFTEGILRARVTLGQGAIGRAAQERRPVQLPDVEAQPDYPFHHLVRAEGFRAILAVPMQAGDELLGGLVVWRRAPGPFPEHQVHLLEALARHSAAAVRNARLYAALEKAYDDTLEALTAALDVRDRDTEGHSRRVAALALAIGREMGLGPQQLQALYRGGLLHDIGKIGIPDRILHKPGPLDEAEWAVMRRHPTLGFQVLRGIDFLMAGSEVVLHHHERYDGRGYPAGLAGEAIPLVARVFAVADAYDAMTSPRPYRAPVEPAAAVAEIVRNAGSQFDPAVVRAFLRVVAAGSAAGGALSTPVG